MKRQTLGLLNALQIIAIKTLFIYCLQKLLGWNQAHEINSKYVTKLWSVSELNETIGIGRNI